MSKKEIGETYTAEETAKRRDAIVRNMIATPPTPHAPLKHKAKRSPTIKPATKTKKRTDSA